MDQDEYDDIIRHLLLIAAHQDTINEDLRESIQHQREFNRQQVEINTDTKTTLARIETLLARMLRHEDNGREA